MLLLVLPYPLKRTTLSGTPSAGKKFFLPKWFARCLAIFEGNPETSTERPAD